MLYIRSFTIVSFFFINAFLAHLRTECSVSYCDHSLSDGVRPFVRRPSVQNFLVNSLASTNINQSAPNLVKMYMTIRSWMSTIMDLIGPELLELPALELEILPCLTLFTLWHLQILTNQYQTWPQYICL